MYQQVSNKVSFPKQEEEILQFWEDQKIFEKSLKQRESAEQYVFYDGPPFATGLPHYGHLLAGTIKDIIPRYQCMRGYYVHRRFGWDCHGLPVEMEMQNELDLKSSTDIENYGIGEFNEACRSIVLRYTGEWEKTVKRMGRWVEFQGGYKTMDTPFMESVWWVFKSLYDKGLIYEGFKVLPYSWKAGTTLSNFEANLNYKDVQDPAVTIRLALPDQEKTYFLAWTTTPWTLISNLALCVNEEINYVKVEDASSGDRYILAKNALGRVFKEESQYKIIQEFPGSELVGKKYRPLFDYAASSIETTNCFQVLSDDYVTDEDGVGIVHLAPAYGEDDQRVCQANDIPVYDAVDGDGNFRSEVDFIAGVNIKEADKVIIKKLKENGQLVHQSTIQHSYPYCWRTDTPLIYKAISTWFVNVEKIKSKMVENNKNIHWVPHHIKEGRFGKWLENARDWAISRNRYWGTPIPIWKNEDGELLCVGSVEELEKLCNQKVDDLHSHRIDKLSLVKDGKTYTRIPEVLDCWFESGSMPIAQNHYPFENKEYFEKNFPADFIAEGLDQTRGWFYTLVVISAALFDKEPFKNVVVNGLILAEDGKKMSKRLKNYPDPKFVLDEYGADSLRMYMINSAVVKGESLKFSEAGIKEVLKSILIPLWNSLSFFTSYANIDQYEYKSLALDALKNPLDRWVLSYLEQTVQSVGDAMDQYELQKAVPPLVAFIERLTNWYIRRSRRRFWKSENDGDKEQAYFALYTILYKLSKLMAPFMPFVSEKIYQILRTPDALESVHLHDYPVYDESVRDRVLENEMDMVETVISLARNLRLSHKIKIRQPLSKMVFISKNAGLKQFAEKNADTILDELNIKKLSFSENEEEFVTLSAKPDFKKLGRKLGPKIKAVQKALSGLSSADIAAAEQTGTFKLSLEDGENLDLDKDEVLLQRSEKEGIAVANDGEITLILDTELSQELIDEGLTRDFINRIQKQRKDIDLDYTDRIEIQIQCDDIVKTALQNNSDYLKKETLADELNFQASIEDGISAELGENECFYTIKKKG